MRSTVTLINNFGDKSSEEQQVSLYNYDFHDSVCSSICVCSILNILVVFN